jgi:hypothetical protein
MRTTIRSRAVWLVAILLLAAALTVSACTGRVGRAHQAGPGTGQTTTQAAPTPDLQDLQSTDQSLQSITSSLQGAASDAATDYSSQDTPLQP